jgi:hypothetical protein
MTNFDSKSVLTANCFVLLLTSRPLCVFLGHFSSTVGVTLLVDVWDGVVVVVRP